MGPGNPGPFVCTSLPQMREGMKKFVWMPLIFFILISSQASTQDKKPLLTLKTAIDIALKQNPTYQAAKFTLEMAKEAERSAWTEYFAKFKGTYSYTRFNEEQHVRQKKVTIPPLTIHAGGSTFQTEPMEFKTPHIVTSRRNVYQYSFSFQQPLFTGWAISSAHKIALLEAERAALEMKEAKLDVIFSVKKAYYNIAYYNILKTLKMKEVAELAVRQLSSHLYVAKNLFEQGVIPKNDLLKSEVALANAKQDLIRAENAVKIAKATLNALLHRDVNLDFALEETSEPKVNLALPEAIQKAWEKRPIVAAAQKAVEKAKAAIKLAQSGYYPQIVLQGEYTKHGDTPKCTGDDITDAEKWSITVLLEWTFFEWGKTRHEVKKARYRELKTREILKEIKDKVALEVKKAYLDMIAAKSNIETAKKAVTQAKENYRVTEERYKEQIDTSTEVLDAQSLLTQAQSYYYTAIYNYDIAIAKLLRAIGEGS